MEKVINTVPNIFFKCGKCGKISDEADLDVSISIFGIVYLVGKEYSWIGYNCISCKKHWLNIEKFKNDELSQLIVQPNSTYLDPSIMGLVYRDLVYHSFPYNFSNSLLEKSADPPIICYPIEIRTGPLPPKLIDEPPNPNWELTDTSYHSYDRKFNLMGPLVSVWSYKDEEVKKLAAYESETGLKAFPRYINYSLIYTDIEFFCWWHRMEIEFYEEIKTNKLEIEQYLSFSSKRSIKKNFDFINLLDSYDINQIGYDFSYFDMWDISYSEMYLYEEVVFGKDHNDLNLGKNIHLPRRIIWTNFLKPYVQDLLGKMADKFIDEYIELSKHIGLTPQTAWKLKEKYLLDIGEAIESRTKREKLKTVAKEHERKRVHEAEKHFPSVKIISDNSDVNKIKIYISYYSKFETKGMKVLLLGETGTGKELFARAIHESSKREGKFQKVDCSSLSETLFESELFGHVKGAFTGANKDKQSPFEIADKGTVFLDEIGNLSLSLQAKLLSVLNDMSYYPVGSTEIKEVDALIVLATSKDIRKGVKEGTFKPDLYYRINSTEYEIPPLRKRKEDIPVLFNTFIHKYIKKRKKPNNGKVFYQLSISDDCFRTLQNFEWLGNVRELEGVAEAIIVKRIALDNSLPIGLNDLPEYIKGNPNHQPFLDIPRTPPKKYGRLPKDDSKLIDLEREGYTRKKVGEMYGVSREAVSRRYSKIKKKTK